MLAVRTATRCHLNYTAWYFKRADKLLCAEFCCFAAAVAHVSGSLSHRDWVAGAALGSDVRVCALFDDAGNC